MQESMARTRCNEMNPSVCDQTVLESDVKKVVRRVAMASCVFQTQAPSAEAVEKAVTDQNPIELSTRLADLFYSSARFLVPSEPLTYLFIPAQEDSGPIFKLTGSKPSVRSNGQVYFLQQFHFHQPAEHYIDDVQYALEAHFVFIAPGNKILALAYTFTQTAGPRKSDQLIRNILVGAPVRMPAMEHNFWAMTGSLTTPPTESNINWQVAQEQLPVTATDLQRLRSRDMLQDARRLQARGGRIIGFNTLV
jgi:hypothetical protein